MATKKTATKKTAGKKKAAKKTAAKKTAAKKTAVKKTATKKTTGRSATTTSTPPAASSTCPTTCLSSVPAWADRHVIIVGASDSNESLLFIYFVENKKMHLKISSISFKNIRS